VLRYKPIEDVMIYTSFSTGFKSGGFNQVRVNDLPSEFDDELALNFELGTKTSWFDNRLQANITGFFTDYNDFQAQVFTGTSINVRNAGRLFSYGFESEFVALPFDSLQVGLNIGFNIAEYDSFIDAEATVEHQRVAATDYLDGLGQIDFNPVGVICGADPLNQLPDPEVVDCSADLTGRELDNAPQWNISAFASHHLDIPGTDAIWFNRADWAYNSNYFLAQDLEPNLHQPGYHLLNLRTGIRAESGLWELTFWVDNVLDTDWAVAGFDVPVVGGFAVVNGPPRQYGGTVRFMF